MGERSSALLTAINSVEALGRGFDVNFNTRLLYCKGIAGTRIVEINEEHCRDLCVYDDVVVPHVSWDINSSQESTGHQSSGICSFHQMVDYFNKNANISGGIPPGSFNSAFSFSGSKHIDALSTKILSMEGFCVPIAKFQLLKSPLVLKENVRKAVPACWDPPSLSSFIESFGTHVITSVTIGGKDMIYVKQHQSSPLSKAEIKNYVQDIAKQRFSDQQSQTSSGQLQYKEKVLDPSLFNGQGIYPQPTSAPYRTGKEVCEKDVTVICRRRGGDDLEQNHVQWAKTVRSSPDIIEMTFWPITSLLDGVNGKEHMIRAIDLYLEYKPPIEELRYFLEFQIPRIWAPVHENIPGHQRKEPVCPSLQFSIMGQKLHVSQEQVSVGRKPVTGLRLCLEGSKQNRLTIHLQHLASLPKILQPYWDTHVAIGAPKWHGPEEQDSRWFEAVKWKNFSHVSTAPIENPETSIGDLCIVTGAQLGVWDFGSRNVLFLKFLYSRIPGCTVRRSLWDHVPNKKLENFTPSGNDANPGNSSLTTEIVSGNKLAKFVDTAAMCKEPEDLPGHWVVTGGKLGVDKGKIVLRVKYSLLNY